MEIVLLFAPLVGSIICGFGHRILGEKISMMVSTGALFISAILSWVVFINFHGDGHTISLFRFIESGSLSADWAIRMDRLTAIMLVVINTVSALVHLYSWGYMDKDPQWKQGESYKPRFFA
ncbi:NADH-quinone oxidoreductase subunit L, partial [Amylibacter sp.]|nr:NADH-quinone oxidoreductase subunit L [Amylibacter sp.]